MLNKLLKYDFKWINKTMYIYFIIIFIVTIAVKIIESLNQTLLIVIIDKIASGLFISCAISIVITCFMRIWARFIQNVYRDESYLTHTLPLTKNDIYNSKIIASILSLILSILVIFICILFIYINSSTLEHIRAMYQFLVDTYNETFAVIFIIGLVLIILLEAISFMMSGILGIVMGYRSNNYKTIKSIVIGVMSYGMLSIISMIILNVMSKVFNFEIINGSFPDLRSIKIMGLTSILIYLIYDLVCYFVAKLVLNKGVNVD